MVADELKYLVIQFLPNVIKITSLYLEVSIISFMFNFWVFNRNFKTKIQILALEFFWNFIIFFPIFSGYFQFSLWKTFSFSKILNPKILIDVYEILLFSPRVSKCWSIFAKFYCFPRFWKIFNFFNMFNEFYQICPRFSKNSTLKKIFNFFKMFIEFYQILPEILLFSKKDFQLFRNF